MKTWLGGEVDFSDRGYQEQLPMVARATASKAIKNNLRQSEMVAEPNISTIQDKIQAIIQRHLEYRRLERQQDPSKIAQSVFNTLECIKIYKCTFQAPHTFLHS